MNLRFTITIMAIAGMMWACDAEPDEPAQPNSKKNKVAKPSPSRKIDSSRYTVPKLPPQLVKINANLQGKVELMGYTLSQQQVLPGGNFTVTWYWKCLAPINENWEYFTHLIDDNGVSLGSQNSSGPTRSAFKPQLWQPGQIIKDPERINVPKDTATKKLELRTGLWRGNLRMPVRKGPVDEENRVKGPTVEVTAHPQKFVSVAPKSVQIPYAKVAPKIDGIFEGEKAWDSAVILDNFTDSLNGTAVPDTTLVKLMWDQHHLYIAMYATDDYIQNAFTKQDDELWREDAFDVFLNPQGDQKEYINIQLSPANVIFDAHYPTYRQAQTDWSSNVKAAVTVKGTLNDNNMGDSSWVGEMAIPFASMPLPNNETPQNGDMWTANFFRINKRQGESRYSAWSPPLRGDFHALNKFGKIQFSSSSK